MLLCRLKGTYRSAKPLQVCLLLLIPMLILLILLLLLLRLLLVLLDILLRGIPAQVTLSTDARPLWLSVWNIEKSLAIEHVGAVRLSVSRFLSSD